MKIFDGSDHTVSSIYYSRNSHLFNITNDKTSQIINSETLNVG